MSKMRFLVENKILVSGNRGKVFHKYEKWQFVCVWYQLCLSVGYFFTRNVSMLENKVI